MGIFQNIRNLFRRGAIAIGAKEQLNSILEHPKIAMEQAEYQRIQDSMRRYNGNSGKTSYLSSTGIKQERTQSTVNMLKKVAYEYAKIMFNEQSDISVDVEESDWINHVFEHNDFKKNFAKYLEPGMALGGLTVRPYFDEVSKEIEFSWALADAFYPLQSNTNNISEGALSFRTIRTEGNKTYYYTLLEFHEWINGVYTITNELYKSEQSEIVGARVGLSELYGDDLQEVAKVENISRPLFTYMKTAGFNNINPYSPLGLGICDNCKQTLDRINRVYDEFDMEIKRGKRRIAVPETLLKGSPDHETGKVKMFLDDKEDIYQIIPGANLDDYSIKDLTFDIRTSEYVAAINHHLKTLEMETGLSNGTFTFDGSAIRSTKTATEIVSEQSQTYQSRNMQINEVEKFIKELVITICELGKAYKLYSGDIPTAEQIGIDFDDGVFIDKEAQKNFYTSLKAAGLLPGHYVLEKVLNLPEAEAIKLYKEAQTGIIEEIAKSTNEPDIDVQEE
ncbi:phage portal protein [uncultured Enterococcus sp.]|uniref:phage portal protein n=1 Tax=uncultured Enterococcus sp. TaxID=167972 RepID=UPI002AA712A6|nr:phage portal protein [uncultured Enterococcus sp.]